MALNPKLFNGDILKPEIQQKLSDIANAFIEYIEGQGVNLSVADIRFLGSNAGYDYTEYSDIDLHIVADFEATTCDSNLMGIALNAERSRFNETYNITVKGIPVELYVEDVNASTASNGIYSITQERWVKEPTVEDELSEESMSTVPSYKSKWEVIISNALRGSQLSEVQRVINRLYMMRKNGLEAAGRQSIGNVVFKEIRNAGLLQQLKDKRAELISKELTLESNFVVESLLRN